MGKGRKEGKGAAHIDFLREGEKKREGSASEKKKSLSPLRGRKGERTLLAQTFLPEGGGGKRLN